MINLTKKKIEENFFPVLKNFENYVINYIPDL